MDKKYIFLIIGLILFLIIIFSNNHQNKIIEEEVNNTEIVNKTENENNETNKFVVYIKGAIKNPGVYNVDKNSYLQQLVDLAGGFTNANLDCLNLAQLLVPHQEIDIPFENESCPVKSSLISINTATLEELTTLPGIGETKAEEIINHREQQPFLAIEELKNVNGIGEKLFEKIKNKITL